MTKNDLIRIISGAIKATKHDHPELFRKNIDITSLSKRIAGSIYGHITNGDGK